MRCGDTGLIHELESASGRKQPLISVFFVVPERPLSGKAASRTRSDRTEPVRFGLS